MGEKGIFGIILSDYSFNESASLRLISLEYAVAQGVLLGFALSALPCAVAAGTYLKYIAYPVFHPAWICLAGVLAILFLIVIRVFLEGAALSIRSRQSANSYFVAARKNLSGNSDDV